MPWTWGGLSMACPTLLSCWKLPGGPAVGNLRYHGPLLWSATFGLVAGTLRLALHGFACPSRRLVVCQLCPERVRLWPLACVCCVCTPLLCWLVVVCPKHYPKPLKPPNPALQKGERNARCDRDAHAQKGSRANRALCERDAIGFNTQPCDLLL